VLRKWARKKEGTGFRIVIDCFGTIAGPEEVTRLLLISLCEALKTGGVI
jgi:hypothetical protein